MNGPVAALVAETDYTYLAFGAGAVIVVFAATLVGVVICRSSRLFETKALLVSKKGLLARLRELSSGRVSQEDEFTVPRHLS